MAVKANPIKDAHSLANIASDLMEHRMTELENVELLYVWSDIEPFGLANEYGWFELPVRNVEEKKIDGILKEIITYDGRWGVICPVSCKPYVESKQAIIGEDNPKDQTVIDRGLWFVHVETVRKNLMLTEHEAARFNQDYDGQCDIIRSISRKIAVFNNVTKKVDDKRLGMFDVIKEASGDFTGLSLGRIGERSFPKGVWAGTKMKDMPLDYIQKGATPGGLGTRDPIIESVCKKELERRKASEKAVGEVTNPEPTATKQPINYCSGTKADGGKCGTVVKADGDYCHQHKRQGVTVNG